MKDPRAVEPLVATLADPRSSGLRSKRSAASASARPFRPRAMLADPSPDVRIEVMLALKHFKHPQVQNALTTVAQSDQDRGVRTSALEILDEWRWPTQSMSQVDAIRKAAWLSPARRRSAAQHAADRHAESGRVRFFISPSASRRSCGSPLTCCARRRSVHRRADRSHVEGSAQRPQWATLERCIRSISATSSRKGALSRERFLRSPRYNGVFRVILKAADDRRAGTAGTSRRDLRLSPGLVLVCGPSVRASRRRWPRS